MKNRNGFTIVEVTIAIAIIAIITSISVVMFTKVQVDARNTDRSSKIGVISDALEKYFNKYGEYPSCSALTQSATQVSTSVLPGIDTNALLVPNSAAGVTNSITCTSLSAGSGPDTFAYVGDGSGTCSTGAACLKYTLQYRKEGTGEIISKTSLHSASLGSSAVPTLTATSVNSTSVNLSWTAVASATQYRYERATDTDFSANRVEATVSNLSASVTGLTAGTTYYFRVLAIASGSEGSWSNTASVASIIATPTSTPTTTAAMSGTNAVGTASVVTCSTGTVQYQLRSRNTNTTTEGSWGSWSSWSTTRTLSVAANQGYRYGFQSHARCYVGPNASSATADSNIPTTVRSISTPVAPTWLTPSSMKSEVYAVVNWSGTCPSGTTRSDATFRSKAWTNSTWGPHPWGYNDSWENASSSNKTVEYWGKYKCKTAHTTSAYSPETYKQITVTP